LCFIDDAHAQLKTIAPALPSSELEDFLGGDEGSNAAPSEDLISSTASESSEASIVVLQDEEPVPQK
jgi:hypothetical protein